MIPCDLCQAQLLDHLYGLLDDAERDAQAAHLEGCEACRAALAAARTQQALLAEAAKTAFPEVRFEPPATPAPEARPPSIKLARPEPARRPWRRWAVAAAVVLALAGVAGAGGWSWHRHHQELTLARARYDQAKREREELTRSSQAEADRAAREIRAIQEEIQHLQQSRTKEQADAQAEAAKKVRVTVIGPRTVEAGARNEYHLETRQTLPGKGAAQSPPLPARLDVRVVNPATGKEYFKQELASKGDFTLVLPPDLPVKPHTQLALVVTARADNGAEAKVTEQLPILGTLYLTHVTTDRPMYRPGEVVRFRSLTLERFSLKPAREDFALVYTITDPSGAPIFSLAGKALLTQGKGHAPLRGPGGKELRGLGAGEFTLPAKAPGGEYTLTVADAQNRFPAERRKFLVNSYQAPRLNKELEFTRKSYGPGDEVVASCKVARVENKDLPVANQPVVATASVDGKKVAKLTLQTDARGHVPPIGFRLPAKVERGQGTLAVQLTDGASVETVVRPIPIVLKNLYVDFYPEGGKLVAGVPNRVYFEARTTLGKPAELRGRVVDDTGAMAAEARTLADDKELGVNQGMGLFQLTPQAGRRYELKIDAPAGVEGRYLLPQADPDGVVLAVPGGVVTDKIDVTLHTARTQRTLLVGAYCRGRVLQHTKVTVKPGEPAHVTLTPAEEAGGVYRITVFEERGGERPQLVPVAERLIYRRPPRRLDLAVSADKKSYSPGSPVSLTFTARSEKGKSAPAVLLVSVVDQSLIKLVDDKTARSMPAHFLLTTEVKKPEDLEYADFLLSNSPKAPAALDLLLGTQGWRRFAEQDPAKFRQNQKQEADRLLLASGLSAPATHDSLVAALARVDQRYQPLYEQKDKELARKEADEEHKQRRDTGELARLGETLNTAQGTLREAETDYEQFTERLLRGGLVALVCLLLLVGVAGIVTGLVRFARDEGHARPYVWAGVCSLALLLMGGLVLVSSLGQGGLEDRVLSLAKTEGPAVRDAMPAPEARMAGGGKAKLADGHVFEQAPRFNAPAPPPEAPAEPAARPEPREKAGDGLERVRPQLEDKAAQVADEKRAEGGQGLLKRGGEVPNLDRLQEQLQQQEPRGQLAARFNQPQNGQAANFAFGPPGGMPGPMGGGPMGGRGAGLPGGGAMPPPGFPGQQGNFNGGFGGGGFGPQGPGNLGGGLAGMGGFQGNNFGGAGLIPPQAERELRRQGRFKDLAQLRMNRAFVPAPPPLEPLVVREYAHRHRPSADGTRHDFAETVCWQPVLVLEGGKGRVSFDLPDSTTRFQVVAWGHTADGRLGAVTDEFASRLPFSLEPKVPTEITNTDKVTIPLAIANDTEAQRSVRLEVSATNLRLAGADKLTLPVGPEQRLRQLFTFRPSKAEGEATVLFAGRCDPFGIDRIQRSFKVVPEGFPFVGSQSDLLEGTAQQTVVLPEGWVKGTLKLQAQAFPSTLADLQKGLEAMLREPNGCFEQTSSTNYPNVLILSYLKESDQTRPDIELRARQLLESGYQKLTSFECQDPQQPRRRGYEWFGGTAPPHEALTAYGLLEFRDMAKVRPVDQAMLERTRQYLLGQRDGKGGFKRNPRALDSFGRAPQHVTDAYIVWALTESGAKDNLDAELDGLTGQARESKDPYFLALVGNSLVGRGRTKDGLDVLRRLATLQKADGHLEGAQMSITGSGGRDLQIETTALATLAWLKANRPADFNTNVQKAARWVGKQRGGFGGFGSTQSTILALKALIAFTKENRRTASAGELRLYVNDGKEPVAVKAFPAGTQEALVVSLPREDLLKAGKNTVRVEMTGKNAFPYTLTWSYNTLKPANAADAPVSLTAKLDRGHADEGETVRLRATVENRSGKGQGMTVAILGLPGGLEVPPDFKQLKEMARLREDGTKPGLISFFELRGRELVLYWRDLAPGQKIDVGLDLVCRVPGEYRGPASRAYLYYNADHKFWAEPLRITVRPRGQ
jgi:anti-sigma factor RsiW